MSDHKHGEMDTTTHEAVFGGFVSIMTKSVIVITAVLILLAIVGA